MAVVCSAWSRLRATRGVDEEMGRVVKLLLMLVKQQQAPVPGYYVSSSINTHISSDFLACTRVDKIGEYDDE
jgi:hypothetical protein